MMDATWMKATGHTALILFQTTHKSLSKQTEEAQRQTFEQLCHGLTLDPGPKQRQSLHKRRTFFKHMEQRE